MTLFTRLLRLRQSKGYGIHSPFAFNLITQTLYSPHFYYAFSDILKEVSQDPDKEQNQLLFRLVNHFKSENVLEIYPGNGIGLLYILSVSADINCTIVENDNKNISYSKNTLGSYNKIREHYSKKGDIKFVPLLEDALHNKYDAIFIDLDKHENLLSSLGRLFDHSSENGFWVIKNINKKPNKQIWRHIVRDERISVTFDIKNKTGIAFMRYAYHKQHYYI